MEIFTHLQNIHSTHTIDPQRQLELSINISKLLDWPTKDSDTAPRIASTLPGPCWLRRNYECEEVSCFFFSFTRPIQWLVCHSFVVHRQKKNSERKMMHKKGTTRMAVLPKIYYNDCYHQEREQGLVVLLKIPQYYCSLSHVRRVVFETIHLSKFTILLRNVIRSDVRRTYDQTINCSC